MVSYDPGNPCAGLPSGIATLLRAGTQILMTTVEREYSLHIWGLTGAGRVQIAAAMYENMRSAYELQIRRANPGLAGRALCIAVARRMYRHDSRALALLRSLESEA